MVQQFCIERMGNSRPLRDQFVDFVRRGSLEPSDGKFRADIGHIDSLCVCGSRSLIGSEEWLDALTREGNDLVCFEHELARLIARSARRSNSYHGDSHSLILSRPHSLSQVLVSRQQESIRNCTLSGQRHQISIDEGIHALLLAFDIDASQPKLYVR